MSELASRTLPLMFLRAYRLIPPRARRVPGVHGSTSHLALAAIRAGGNGWAALWRYGRIVPGRTGGGFWGDWGT